MTPTGFRLGEFVVEPDADRLIRPSTAARVNLEPKAMAVLVVLAERSGQVVCSEELIRRVWQGRPMGDNPVYKAIAKLRRALHDDADHPRYIETISRKGYRLLVEPQPLLPARSAATQVNGSLRTKPKRTLTRRVSLALAAWLGAASLGAFYLMWPQSVPAYTHPAPLKLPAATQLLYQSARLELQVRRPGFAHRLRRDAEALIEDAPDLADGHALRAVACSLELDDSPRPANELQRSRIVARSEPMRCARESSRRALELDTSSPLALVATRLAERERAAGCTGSASACLAEVSAPLPAHGSYRRAAPPREEGSVRLARVH